MSHVSNSDGDVDLLTPLEILDLTSDLVDGVFERL